MRLALLYLLFTVGCNNSSATKFDASSDLTSAADQAEVGDAALAVDMTNNADLATTPDFAAPCGGPLQPCCGVQQTCDQDAAHNVAWFGSVCSGGTCQHCGGDGFKTEGGDGSLCCAAPTQCIVGDTCTTTADGPRCF